jgi:hypothetical protein
MGRWLALGLFIACGRPAPVADELGWLRGAWEFRKDDILTQERWVTTPDGDLLGSGRVVLPDRLGFAETLAITRGPAGVPVYTAWPTGQEPVPFPLQSQGDRTATFANPQHDFPQSITYTRTGETGMQVDLVGQGATGPRTETWTLQLATP